MATYNGSQYLLEQLESIENQEDVIVRVWVNDDGSDDGTIEILSNWQKKGIIRNISKTDRIGSTRAFLKLLSEHTDSEYVAFCDQDDIWESDKLATQIQMVKNEIPTCVTSQRLYIDKTGSILGNSIGLNSKPSFENALVENIAYGNTMLINKKAIELINILPNPKIEHYDSWIYLLVSAFGEVVEVPLPLTKYRIHPRNAVGLRKMSLNSIRVSIANFANQNLFLLENFPNAEQILQLKLFKELLFEKSLIRRFVIIQRIDFKRQKFYDQVIFKMLLLFVK